MKKIILLFTLIFLIVSCNSVKKTQKALNSGNYDKAINLSIQNLKKNKTKLKNQDYVASLETAFEKAKKRDEAKINFLIKENNPEKLVTIYSLYQQLKNRQEKIKPLLPLQNFKTGRIAKFKMHNYDDDLLDAKEKYTEYLYQKSLITFNQGQYDKYKYRVAYKKLQSLNKLYPNYKDVKSLINEAYNRGTDYITVSVNNRTRQIIPRRLEQELLAMDTYGLDNVWTVYHAQRNSQITYDYRLELDLVEIHISPERIREKEIVKEKLIKDGFKYLLDKKGNYIKDSLGNRIKEEKFIKTRCKVYKFTQFKSSSIIGIVKYIDDYSNRLLNKFPIESEFIFEHVYAKHRGDTRALGAPLYDLIQRREVRFPTNEQMVYDTGTDLKDKFKHIITTNQFER